MESKIKAIEAILESYIVDTPNASHIIHGTDIYNIIKEIASLIERGNKYIKVIAAQDDSSHWYLIPNELENDFRELSEKVREALDNDKSLQDVIKEFTEEFGKYRTGGSINNTQLYIEK